MTIQEQVQETLDELVASGAELGIQVVAYRDGVKVVDAVAGVLLRTGRRSRGHCLLQLLYGQGSDVDPGASGGRPWRFRYDTPVVELWPEFGAHGKEGVTVRHVLDPYRRMPGIPLSPQCSDVSTWDTMIRALENAELWWEPGTKTGYHAYTFGYLAGEIVRRSTGLPLAEVLRDRLAAPLGSPTRCSSACRRTSEDPWRRWSMRRVRSIGPLCRCPRICRCSAQRPCRCSQRPTSATTRKSIGADIPAGGKTSARAIAKMYAALLG